ncbi:nitroreductase [Mycobacterium spongiae]|uniref:Nitroreductase n=2 Tax=Mycobacterium spongiae TaxID=886343 RepID=A0A975K3A3_9MYCO|nr:nitroreductase [Mycobacterium spongiae]
MTQQQQAPGTNDTSLAGKFRRSPLWRAKLRLQFTGWLQYLITTVVAAALLITALVGWLVGVWPLVLFWLPLSVGVLLLAATGFDVVTVKWGVRPSEPIPHRHDDVDTFELIRSRRSCRSFQSRDLTRADRAELMDAVTEHTRDDRLIGTSPIRLEYVAAPLTVWPVAGAHEFLVAIAPRNYDRLAIIDIGRSLEKVVLHATRMGIATCWIGPGADQTSVITHLGDRFDPETDHVVCVCAVGYRSRFQPLFVRLMSRLQRRRLPLRSLFFANPDLDVPLDVSTAPFSAFGRCYQACQWAPSSYNAQPVRCAAVTTQVGTQQKAVRFDFYATNTSRFYTPVALGIWAANWETGCDALGIRGHFTIPLGDRNDDTGAAHRDLSWIADQG